MIILCRIQIGRKFGLCRKAHSNLNRFKMVDVASSKNMEKASFAAMESGYNEVEHRFLQGF